MERAAKWVRRQPVVASLIALVVVVTLVGFGLVLWKWLDEVEARQTAETAEARTRDALTRETAALASAREATTTAQVALASETKALGEKEEARKKLEIELDLSKARDYAFKIAAAQRDVLDGFVARAGPTLAACLEPLRHWEYRYLSSLCREQMHLLHNHKGKIATLAYTGDGRLFSVSGDAVSGGDLTCLHCSQKIEAGAPCPDYGGNGRIPCPGHVLHLDRAARGETMSVRTGEIGAAGAERDHHVHHAAGAQDLRCTSKIQLLRSLAFDEKLEFVAIGAEQEHR